MDLNKVPKEQVEYFTMIANMLTHPSQELVNLIINETGAYAIYRDIATGHLEDIELATVVAEH